VGPAASRGPGERLFGTAVLRRAQQDAATVADASSVVIVTAEAETAQHRQTKPDVLQGTGRGQHIGPQDICHIGRLGRKPMQQHK